MTSPLRLACLGNPDPGDPQCYPTLFRMAPPYASRTFGPRASRGQGLSDRARRSRFASSAGVETGGSGPSPRVARFVYPVTTRRMGWDSFATNDFRRCRFSRSAKGAQGLPKGSPLKARTKRSLSRPQRRAETEAQRAKSSQTETQRAKSRPLTRQVSDKSRLVYLEMTRSGQERDSLTLLCSVGAGFRNGTPGR